MKSKIIRIITALSPIVAIPVFYMVFQTFHRTALPCPLNLFTGIYCLGCGGTRCTDALFHGKIFLALRQNAIVVFAVIFLLLMWIRNLSALLGRKVKTIPDDRRFYVAVSGIMLFYAILRNFIPAIAPV